MNSQTQHLYHRAPIDPENDNDSLAKIARLVPPGSTVLDVGCGVGRLGQFLAIDRGCAVDGINANRMELDLAGPFYRLLWEWNLERHHLPRSLLKQRYDIIVCADVLEHLRDPGRLLQLLQTVLQPTGKILISIPNIGHIGIILELLGGDFHYRHEGLLDETHLRFFTRQSFLRFLKDYGFSGSIVDETVVPLQASEFAQWATHLIQLNLRQDLNKDKIVYQYIVVATPQGNASMLPATLPAIRHWSPSANIGVFWGSEGEQFAQERSHSLTMPLDGDRYQMVFNIPPVKIQRLRIDPIDMPGDIWLYGLRLMGGDRILWSWDGTSQGVSSLEMQQLEILPYALAPHGIGLRASGNDPQILLSLPGSLLEQCTQVILELKYIIQKDWHDALIRMKNQLDVLQDQLQKNNDEISTLSNTLKNTLRSRSWRVTRPMRSMAQLARTAREALRPGPLGQQNRYAIIRGLYRALPLPKTLRNSISRRMHVARSQRTYADWIRNFDTLRESDRSTIRAQVASWEKPPRISVLMPVYNPPVKYLQLAIDSVCQQLYPHWELCIVDDASTDPKVREVLTRSVENDHRIKVKHRAENGHISVASNDALAMATGEYVALLDHDDLLTEHALYWVAATALANPHADLIYSDEDKIDEAGVRSDPYFKPDWNPELLLGQNYINHLGCYRRERVESIGGFRLGYEGSQDWDLVLRFTEGLDASRIVHIPAVLYHWRMLSSSTAVSLDAKPYAIEASRKAVLDHLERQGIAVDMEAVCNCVYHLPRFQVQGMPLVSIIIPTRNGFADLESCVESLDRTSWKNTELLIIDNQSDDPKTLEYLRSEERR
uniref:glycosyltransferase n=1 Tax=Candidatus Igneacidithiobacillus taiwanensis TaxID=1945924 RepID=UPI0028A18B45